MEYFHSKSGFSETGVSLNVLLVQCFPIGSGVTDSFEPVPTSILLPRAAHASRTSLSLVLTQRQALIREWRGGGSCSRSQAFPKRRWDRAAVASERVRAGALLRAPIAALGAASAQPATVLSPGSVLSAPACDPPARGCGAAQPPCTLPL